MEVLRAGWRNEYVSKSDSHETSKPKGCIFCEFPKQDMDRDHLIVARGEHAFVMMNKFPYSSGHLMVIPYRHTDALESLSDPECSEMHRLAREAVTALKKIYSPHGFNLGMNLGSSAGAGIAEHLHMHIVPRWNGDTNFMSVTAESKVLPETLLSTYTKLIGAWG